MSTDLLTRFVRGLLPGLAHSAVLMAALLAGSSVQAAAAVPSGDSSILPSDSQLEELWNEGEFTEGVAVAADGQVYFSDIAFGEGPGRILKYDPKTGKTTVHCADSGKSNGLMFDGKGRLLAACGAHHGHRGLVEILPDGQVRIIVDKFKGKRFNSPNDLVVHPNGSVYFSDPRYVGAEPMEMKQMSVYRYDPDGSIHRVTTNDVIEKPNGVHVSPDGKTLYVAETNNGSSDVTKDDPTVKPGRMTLNALEINADGSLGEKKVLADFGKGVGTDGMSIDQQGNIYAAVRKDDRHGIIVFTPQGKELAYIPTEELPTNCCFGVGPNAKTLYITAGGGLYRIRLAQAGFHPGMKK